MGSSKKQTVGYWYPFDIHFGLCRSIDAFLEFRGGDKTAWAGRVTANTTINVDAPYLWGGEDGEGGIVGPVDIMFGEPAQAPNSYLVSTFGPQSAYRGKVTVALKNVRYGAFNPYPKPAAFKVERFINGWPGGTAWYAAKAPIPLLALREPWYSAQGWENRGTGYFVIGAAQETSGDLMLFQGWWHGNIDSFRITRNIARYAVSEYAVPTADFGNSLATDPYYDDVVLLLRMEGADESTTFIDEKGHVVNAHGDAHISTDRFKWGTSSGFFNGIDAWLEAIVGADEELGAAWTMDGWVWLDTFADSPLTYNRALFGYGPVDVGSDDTVWGCVGNSWYYIQHPYTDFSDPEIVQNYEPFMELGRWAFVSACKTAGGLYYLHQDGKLLTVTSTLTGMNPAHILRYSKISPTMEARPSGQLDDDNWEAAADKLFAEGFGLCTEWNPASESIDRFQDRICAVIGGAIAKSRKDGKWRLHLFRGDYDLESLPILTDADILEWKEQPSVLDDAVNQVQTKWFDPINKEERITAPEHALGAIEAFGGVVSQVVDFPEIPIETLALRVNSRELKARSTPLKRFSLICKRTPSDWDAGTYFRLQAPKRGIADMVCLVGEIDVGTTPSSAISLVVVEDIYSMPETSYLEPAEVIDTSPTGEPTLVTVQKLFEAPYVDLAGAMPTGELTAMTDESGYALVVAKAPVNGINYSLFTAADAEAYEDAGIFDWCPTAIIEAAVDDPGETEFVLADMIGLENVTVGTAALWDDEIVRVDAYDPITGDVTFGRACGDTVPAPHGINSRVWFYDAWAGTDQREYVLGEVVNAKALTRTSSARVNIVLATPMSVEMDQRAARPYPPAAVTINDTWPPLSVTGEFELEWVHRDRVLQADQLVEWAAASIGPEPGTQYKARFYDADDVLLHETALITGDNTLVDFAYTGDVTMRFVSVRDTLESWQAVTATFFFDSEGLARLTETGDLRITETDILRITED